MRARVESCASFVTRACRAPRPLIVPAKMSSLTAFSIGIDSPVIAAWSTAELPEMIFGVGRDPLVGLDDDDVLQRQLLDGDLDEASAALDPRRVRGEIHQRAYRVLGAVERVLLQRVRGREQREQDRTLGPVIGDRRSDRREHHQQVDIDMTLDQVLDRRARRQRAAGQIGEHIDADLDRLGHVHHMLQRQPEHGEEPCQASEHGELPLAKPRGERVGLRVPACCHLTVDYRRLCHHDYPLLPTPFRGSSISERIGRT